MAEPLVVAPESVKTAVKPRKPSTSNQELTGRFSLCTRPYPRLCSPVMLQRHDYGLVHLCRLLEANISVWIPPIGRGMLLFSPRPASMLSLCSWETVKPGHKAISLPAAFGHPLSNCCMADSWWLQPYPALYEDMALLYQFSQWHIQSVASLELIVTNKYSSYSWAAQLHLKV